MSEKEGEPGWEFVAHVEGSAYHQPQSVSSWIRYWMEHVGVKEPPCLCPGDPDPVTPENKSAHPLDKNESRRVNTVGCHVILKKENKRAFAIIPACNKCNKADRSKGNGTLGNLIWYCKAVTILEEDASDFNFVGKITVPVKDSEGNPKSVWWQDIMDISDVLADGGKTNTLTIRGYTNIDKGTKTTGVCGECKFKVDTNFSENEKFLVCSECKRREYTYWSPEGYLLKIASFWKYVNSNLGGRGALNDFEKKFQPRVLRCQEKRYPKKNQVAYKKAYGLCTNQGCHKDSLPTAELCEEHWRDEAAANAALTEQLDELLIQ